MTTELDDEEDSPFSARGRRIQAAADELIRTGVLLPLAAGDATALLRFLDMDLCSMVEGALGERPDPLRLTAEERQRLLGRLGESYRPPPPRGEYRTRYFLCDAGLPVGTLSLDDVDSGPGLVRVSALYLHPAHRGRGLVEGALAGLQAALGRQKLGGVRLDTHWVWQPAVRYYLRRRFWLFLWKHDLSLMWHRALPAYRIEIEGDRATLLIEEEGQWRWLYRAERDGERLRLLGADLTREERYAYFVAVHGEATLSLALAVAGWPLLRSAEEFEEHKYSDSGPPEALAYRVEWWEALARQRGWVVDTPRIPGIPYRSYEELAGEDED